MNKTKTTLNKQEPSSNHNLVHSNSMRNLVLDISDFASNTRVLDFLIKIIVPQEFWIPDHYELFCRCCYKTFFVFFRRKHHCRGCGHLFCDRCSKDSLEIKNPEILESRFHKISLMAQKSKRFEKKMRLCGKCFLRIHSDLVAVVNGTIKLNQEVFTQVEEVSKGRMKKINSVLAIKRSPSGQEARELVDFTNSQSKIKSNKNSFVVQSNLQAVSDPLSPNHIQFCKDPLPNANYFVTLAQRSLAKMNLIDEGYFEERESSNKQKGLFWKIFLDKIAIEYLDYGLSPLLFQDYPEEVVEYLEFMRKAGRKIIKDPPNLNGLVARQGGKENLAFLIKCVSIGEDGNSRFCSLFRGSFIQNQQLVNAKRALRRTQPANVLMIESSMDIQGIILGTKDTNSFKEPVTTNNSGSTTQKSSFAAKESLIKKTDAVYLEKEIPEPPQKSPKIFRKYVEFGKNSDSDSSYKGTYPKSSLAQRSRFRHKTSPNRVKESLLIPAGDSIVESSFPITENSSVLSRGSSFSLYGSPKQKNQSNVSEKRKKTTIHMQNNEKVPKKLKPYVRFEQIAEKELNILVAVANKLIEFEANVLVFRDYIPRLLQETLRKRGIVIISNVKEKDFNRICQSFDIKTIATLSSLKSCLQNKGEYIGKCGKMTVEPCLPLPYAKAPEKNEEDSEYSLYEEKSNLSIRANPEMVRKESSFSEATSRVINEEKKENPDAEMVYLIQEGNMEEKLQIKGEVPSGELRGFGFFENFKKKKRVPWQIILTGEKMEDLKRMKIEFRHVLFHSLYLNYEHFFCVYDLKHACRIEEKHGNILKLNIEEQEHLHKAVKDKLDDLPREISLSHTGDFTTSLALRMGFHAFHRLFSVKLIKVPLVPMRKTTILKDITVDIFTRLSSMLESIQSISNYIYNIGTIDYEAYFSEMAEIFAKRRRNSYDLSEDMKDFPSQNESRNSPRNLMSTIERFKIVNGLSESSDNERPTVVGKDMEKLASLYQKEMGYIAAKSRIKSGTSTKKDESAQNKILFQNLTEFHKTMENRYSFLNNMPFLLGSGYYSILSSFNLSKCFALMQRCKDVCKQEVILHGEEYLSFRQYLNHKLEAAKTACTCGNQLLDHLMVYYINNRTVTVKFASNEVLGLDSKKVHGLTKMQRGRRKSSNSQLRLQKNEGTQSSKNRKNSLASEQWTPSKVHFYQEDLNASEEGKAKKKAPKRFSFSRNPPSPNLVFKESEVYNSQGRVSAHSISSNEELPPSRLNSLTKSLVFINSRQNKYSPSMTLRNSETNRNKDIYFNEEYFQEKKPKGFAKMHFECVYCHHEVSPPEILPEKTLNMSFALFLFELGYSTSFGGQTYTRDLKGNFQSDNGECFHRICSRVFQFGGLKMFIQIQPSILFKYVTPGFPNLIKANSRRERCQEFSHCEYQLFFKSAHIAVQFLQESLITLHYFIEQLVSIISLKNTKDFLAFLSKKDEQLRSSFSDICANSPGHSSFVEFQNKIFALLRELDKILTEQNQNEFLMQGSSPSAYLRSKHFNDFLWVGSQRMAFYDRISKIIEQISSLYSGFVNLVTIGSGQRIVGRITSRLIGDQFFGSGEANYNYEQLRIVLSFKQTLKLIIRFNQFVNKRDSPAGADSSNIYSKESQRPHRYEKPNSLVHKNSGSRIPSPELPERRGSKPILKKNNPSFLIEEEKQEGGRGNESETKISFDGGQDRNSKSNFINSIRSLGSGCHFLNDQPDFDLPHEMAYVIFYDLRLILGHGGFKGADLHSDSK